LQIHQGKQLGLPGLIDLKSKRKIKVVETDCKGKQNLAFRVRSLSALVESKDGPTKRKVKVFAFGRDKLSMRTRWLADPPRASNLAFLAFEM
jgi:hypothetical protein